MEMVNFLFLPKFFLHRFLLFLGSGMWKNLGWYNHGDTKSLWYNSFTKFKITTNSGEHNDENFNLDYDFDLSEQNKFPLDDNSLNNVYTSHLIEHLTNPDVNFLFKDVYRLLKKDGVFRITCPDIDILYDGIFQEDKNNFNNPWKFYGIERNKLSNVDEFLWCSFGYFSESLKIKDTYLIDDMDTYNKFLNIEKICDDTFYKLIHEKGKYGTFEHIRKKSELLYPIFKYQLTGLHIN